MSKNIFRTPLAIATILEGIALLIFISCISAQEQICSVMMYSGNKTLPHIVPGIELFLRLIYFAISLIALLVANSYAGESRRGVAAAFAALRCFFTLSAQYLSIFSTQVYALQGQEALVVHNCILQGFNFIATPFMVCSLAFFFIGLGRYGMTKNEAEL